LSKRVSLVLGQVLPTFEFKVKPAILAAMAFQVSDKLRIAEAKNIVNARY
jgi:hypothetical protein